MGEVGDTEKMCRTEESEEGNSPMANASKPGSIPKKKKKDVEKKKVKTK